MHDLPQGTPPHADSVVGIKAGEDELRAQVVVAADGVNSFLCREAGIRAKEPTNHLAVGVKSVIRLPRAVIEERFNLRGDEGAAYAVVGDSTKGLGGGGFLYTNIDSLSIGVVLRLALRRFPVLAGSRRSHRLYFLLYG